MDKWHSIYPKLAGALHRFQKENKDPGNALFLFLNNNEDFKDLNPWFKKDEYGRREDSIDPIVLFSSFNDGFLQGVNKLRRLNCALLLFGEKPYKHVDFTGCPTPITLKMISGRVKSQQVEIWSFFDRILSGGQHALIESDLKLFKDWYGVSLVSVTMFLFWISPTDFLPLDKYTTAYLRKTEDISTPKTIKGYKILLEKTNGQGYINLSKKAFAEAGKLDIEFEVSLEEHISLNAAQHSKSERPTPPSKMPIPGPNAFKLVALRLHDDPSGDFLKSLTKGVYYIFYKAYSFVSDDNIRFNKSKAFDFYHLKDLKVNISAIVGANGAGKSSIVQLLLAGINNISKFISTNSGPLTAVKGLDLEIYFHSEHFYRLELKDEKVFLFRYQEDGCNFVTPESVEQLDTERFFYSMFVNHSLYGFTDRKLNKWLKAIYEHQEHYRFPINISPYRIGGNIDVFREEIILRHRLLANILEPISTESEQDEFTNMRILAPGKLAESICFKYNQTKIQNIKRKLHLSEGTDWNNVLQQCYQVLGIQGDAPVVDVQLMGSYRDICHLYILGKLIDIAKRTPHYSKYFGATELLSVPEYLQELSLDYSQTTMKIRQVINQLNYGDLFELEQLEGESSLTYSVSELSAKLTNFLSRIQDSAGLEIIDFLPPSFIETEILLKDSGRFSHMSSGEKQRINVLGSIAYQLRNINGLIELDGYKYYPHVNIVLDEIELYFHPEMQRTFIKALLDYINKLGLDNLISLNICFVTHSPFILSDIPTDNILSLPFQENFSEVNTFGANIHTLLADQFFLKNGFMGDMANKIIANFSDRLTDEEHNMTPEDFKGALEFISKIGEPLIQDSLILLLQQKKIKQSVDDKSRSDMVNFLKQQIKKYEDEED